MRGVLPDDQLRMYALTALFTADLTPVITDGHAFPAAATFLWPDGSPGLMIRLEEVAGLPSKLELTHVSAGRRIEISISETSFMRLFFDAMGVGTLQGHGSPEGVVSGANRFYWDLDSERMYYQPAISAQTTGWKLMP